MSPWTPNYLSENAYDFTKWNLGNWWIFNNWGSSEEKYFQAHIGAIRPLEESTPFAVVQIAAHILSTDVAYIFGVENLATASAARRIALWEMDRKNGAVQWKGFITLTLTTATAHTLRDFKMDVKNESTGTVEVSWTAVTGTSTLFATNKVAVGARIWFGSTDPSQITQRYRITARGSDTSLTLATSATVSAGTPYVIQEFRPIYTATNATLTNGWIHYAKWVSIEDFTITGTTIPAAVSTDDQKAVYWIKDAATQTNTVAAWCAIDFATATPTSLDAYVLDLVSAGNYKVYKYNLRAALTVASGASVSWFTLATGNNSFTGTGAQNSNLCIATTSHWTGSWVKSLYAVSTTRLMRIPVASVTSWSTSIISDNVVEIAPWGATTYAATSLMNTIEYLPTIDSFVIGTTTSFSYITQYVSWWQQFQRMFGRNYLYLEQSSKDNWAPTIFNNSATVFAFVEAGWNRVFAVKQGATASLNQVYIMAFGCDWDYAENSEWRLISPKILTPNCESFDRAYTDIINYLWSSALWKSTEPYRIYARTTNIESDMTTGWILLNGLNDLSWLSWASAIQFAIEVRVIWETCTPPRVLGVNVAYNDNTTDSHYLPSADLSNKATKIFAWKFATAFGSVVPTLRVRLYDAVSGWLLVDTTTLWTGTWEKSTDGTIWGVYNTTDKANDTTFIRFTPASLADNIQVRALLTIN